VHIKSSNSYHTVSYLHQTFLNLKSQSHTKKNLTAWVDRLVEEEYVDHFSQKPTPDDSIILGMGSFQMSLSHTEVHHSSRYLTMYEICHRTDSLVPSTALGTFLQQFTYHLLILSIKEITATLLCMH